MGDIHKILQAIRISFVGAEIVYLENSYGFFKILQQLYPEAEPWIFGNSVVAKIGNKFYNISGQVKGTFKPLTKEQINYYKKQSHGRFYKRTIDAVPANKFKGRQRKIHPADIVFAGYYYDWNHDPSVADETKRLRDFFYQ
jgi:hypothetical protein